MRQLAHAQYDCFVHLYDPRSDAEELIEICRQEFKLAREYKTVLALMMCTNDSELTEEEKVIFERISKFSAEKNVFSFHCCIDKDPHQNICVIFETLVKRFKTHALETFEEKERERKRNRANRYCFGLVKIRTRPTFRGMYGYSEESEDDECVNLLRRRFNDLYGYSNRKRLRDGDCVIYNFDTYMNDRPFHDEISPREDGLVLLYSSYAQAAAKVVEDLTRITDKFKKPVIILGLRNRESGNIRRELSSAITKFANERELLALEMNVKNSSDSEIRKIFAHLAGEKQYRASSRCIIL